MSDALSVTHHDVTYYAGLLTEGKPFALSRYGDGEWYAILGRQGQNCDGHSYFPDLGEDLRRSLLTRQRGRFFYALGPLAKREVGDEARRWLADNHAPAIAWHHTDTFIEASIEGRLWPLVQALRGQRVLYVGPDYLHRAQTVAGLFSVEAWVSVPQTNAYLHKVELLQATFRAMHTASPTVIGFSAGMLSNVLIDRLWRVGGHTTLIDFGSVFDGYAGRISRSYHKRYDWDHLRKLNTGGKR